MSLLISTLKNINIIDTFTLTHWNILIGQARSEKLLGRLYYLFVKNNKTDLIPPKVILHFSSSYKLFLRQQNDVLREVDTIQQKFKYKQIPCIFLKGAAYILADLPCAKGRLLSDIDVLVKSDLIKKAEIQLMVLGWISQKIEDYDDEYYRKWMHEIPPMQHVNRGSVIDLHHNILPLTNTDYSTSRKYNTQELKSLNNTLILDNMDIVIHSSVHLFTESEYNNGLRDLSDLDILIRHFSSIDNQFIEKLVARANEQKLSLYIWLTFQYSSKILATPIDKKQQSFLVKKPKTIMHEMYYNFCFINIFKPNHSSCRDWKMSLSEFLLYWRGHFLRMPLRLLIPHLTRKSFMRLRDYFKQDDTLKQIP